MPTKRPFYWLIWHPHQHLWNWDLMEFCNHLFLPQWLKKWLTEAIITADTGLLWLRIICQRLFQCGLWALRRVTADIGDKQILYLDVGLHADARELRYVTDELIKRELSFEAHGFEASRQYAKQAQTALSSNSNVQVHHVALCREVPPSKQVKLYTDGSNGLSNSLYRSEYPTYELVPALKLSEWLAEQNIDWLNTICILRMNIEGAEYDVIEDLIESGYHQKIAGYFGMWDDVSKIDPEKDKRFRSLLLKHGISPITFNGRDFRSPARLAAIKYHWETCVMGSL